LRWWFWRRRRWFRRHEQINPMTWEKDRRFTEFVFEEGDAGQDDFRMADRCPDEHPSLLWTTSASTTTVDNRSDSAGDQPAQGVQFFLSERLEKESS
jgi:hypothetical protein